MKKLFNTVIALLLPMLASAYDVEVGGIYYILNPSDQTAIVTYQYPLGFFIDIDKFISPYSGVMSVPSSFTNPDDGVTYTVTSIGASAFRDCDNLTSIMIPSSVTSIEASAFDNCTSLISITIPSSVTSIGGYAFENTAWYNSQPDGLVYAGNVVYRYKGTMPDNTSITIKTGTVGISEGAFSGCSGLTSITIPYGVTSLENSVFYGCIGLTSVTIPNSVTSIGRYDIIGIGTFQGCSSLTSIAIPNSVTNIGASTFEGCGLTSITIPASVTSIGPNAFRCDNLLSVTSYITEPFSISYSGMSGDVYSFTPFSKNTYRKGTLYVPAETKDQYTKYDGWREFLKIEEMVGQTYYLTIKDSNNGTVDLKVKLGEKYTLMISPKNGRTVKNVYYNDDDVTKQLDANNCFTTPAISANSTLRVVYNGDKRGDLNGDDKVDVSDHVELSKIIMNQ